MDNMTRRDVDSFMDAIENGGISAGDAFLLLKNVDPLLSYFLLRYLREKYPIKENGEAAGTRLYELLTSQEGVEKLAATPKKEALVDWFNDTYSMREFFNTRNEFLELIIDKIEG